MTPVDLERRRTRRRDASSTPACRTGRLRRSGRSRTRRRRARRRSPGLARRGCASRAPAGSGPSAGSSNSQARLPLARSNAVTRNVILPSPLAGPPPSGRSPASSGVAALHQSRARPTRPLPRLRGHEHQVAPDDRRRDAEPATAAFQAMFSVSLHLTGSWLPARRPMAEGPRQCGQLSAARSAVNSPTVAVIRADALRMRISILSGDAADDPHPPDGPLCVADEFDRVATRCSGRDDRPIRSVETDRVAVERDLSVRPRH